MALLRATQTANRTNPNQKPRLVWMYSNSFFDSTVKFS